MFSLKINNKKLFPSSILLEIKQISQKSITTALALRAGALGFTAQQDAS